MYRRFCRQPDTHGLPGVAALLGVPGTALRSTARVVAILAFSCLPPAAIGGEPGLDVLSPRALPAEPRLLERSTKHLSEANRAVISGHVGTVWIKGVTTLSKEDATALAAVRGPLSVSVSELSLVCAQELSNHRGHMDIHELTTLSDESARSLGRHHGALRLFDCHTLSGNAIQGLVQGSVTELRLDITDIDPKAARALGTFKGDVELCNLTRLDRDSAKALSSHRGALRLGLSELTPDEATALAQKPGRLTLKLGRTDKPLNLTAETAESLSRYEDAKIELWNVTFDPSPEAVLDAFAGYRGHLSVTLRDPLTDESAQALAGSKGSLTVFLPKDSPAGPVRWLARHPGDLCIWGLPAYPLDVARALADHRGGGLTLIGVDQISEEVAAALAEHAGPLKLFFLIRASDSEKATVGFGNSPSSEVVNMLCRHRGTLHMPADWVRPDTIESILAHVGGLSVWAPISFNFQLNWFGPSEQSKFTWDWMPLDLFEQLATYPGPLQLSGELTDEMVQALAKHRGDLSIGLPQSELAAEILVNREGRLFLTCVSNTKTVAAATVFASEKNRTPVCTTPHLIGPDAVEIASILVKRKGEFSLPYLKHVRADALRILATKEDIRLPPLDRLYILSDDGRDVPADEVVSAEFLRKNAENQPPPAMPEWHSWDKLLSEHE